MKRRCFATSLVWTEIIEVKRAPNGPPVDYVYVFAPGQYLSEIERLVKAQFGSLKSYDHKTDNKKGSYLQIRTGAHANKKAIEVTNWINQQRSSSYAENPELVTGLSASQQGYSASDNNAVANAPANNQPTGNNNNMYIILGIIAVVLVMVILFKKKKG